MRFFSIYAHGFLETWFIKNNWKQEHWAGKEVMFIWMKYIKSTVTKWGKNFKRISLPWETFLPTLQTLWYSEADFVLGLAQPQFLCFFAKQQQKVKLLCSLSAYNESCYTLNNWRKKYKLCSICSFMFMVLNLYIDYPSWYLFHLAIIPGYLLHDLLIPIQCHAGDEGKRKNQ